MPLIPRPPYDVNVENWPITSAPSIKYRQQFVDFGINPGGQSVTIPPGVSWDVLSITVIALSEPATTQTFGIAITDQNGNYIYSVSSATLAAAGANVLTFAKGLNVTANSNGTLPPTIYGTDSFVSFSLDQGWIINLYRVKGGGAALAANLTVCINYLETTKKG